MTEDRPNAMLTKTQRDFLNEDKTYTGDTAKQQRYQRRQAIKKRVRNTLLDFKLLFDTWHERGSGELFGEDPSSGEMGKAISALLALLYTETYRHGRFKNLLQRGVQRGEARVHPEDDAMVRTNFQVEHIPRVDTKEAIERYKRRGELNDMSPDELAKIAKLLRQEGGREIAEMAEEGWQKKLDRLGVTETDTEE